VRVRVGRLAAEVTQAAVEELGLRQGERVVASFKATGARLVPLVPDERHSPSDVEDGPL
jgi:hypothetical protein